MPCSALTFTLPFGASASRKIWLSTFRARVMSSGCGRAMLSPLTSWSLPSATPSACRALRATSLRVLRRSFSARCGSCGACVGPGSGPGSTSLRCPRPCRSDMRGRCVRRQASNAPSPESRRPSCRAPRFAAVSGLQARLREPSDRSDAAVRRYAVPFVREGLHCIHVDIAGSFLAARSVSPTYRFCYPSRSAETGPGPTCERQRGIARRWHG